MIQYLVEEAHQYDNNTDANFFVHLEHKRVLCTSIRLETNDYCSLLMGWMNENLLITG